MDRKTGISIQDTGVRNEDGLEEMSNFFSPTPSVRHSSLPAEAEEDDEFYESEDQNHTIVEEKSMDLAHTSTSVPSRAYRPPPHPSHLQPH